MVGSYSGGNCSEVDCRHSNCQTLPRDCSQRGVAFGQVFATHALHQAQHTCDDCRQTRAGAASKCERLVPSFGVFRGGCANHQPTWVQFAARADWANMGAPISNLCEPLRPQWGLVSVGKVAMIRQPREEDHSKTLHEQLRRSRNRLRGLAKHRI